MKMKQSQLNSPLPRFLTVEEVAEMLRVNETRLGVELELVSAATLGGVRRPKGSTGTRIEESQVNSHSATA
jgi:hypothetical protein